MKIFEGYNMAEKEYGQEVAEIMKQNGIPKNFIQAACRFHIKEGVPVEQLQNDWKMWNRYVLMNPQYKDNTGHNKNLATMSYKDFKAEIQNFQQPYLCPNPIYDDGILSIGECKTQRDARWFPLQNLAYPEENNDFCICKKAGGFMKFLGYKSQGYRILLIYDKSRSASDPYKRMGILVKDGVLSFWDNYDKPCGTTKYTNDPIWRYIDSLPTKAQLALSEFAEGKITESKSNKNMKTKKRTITESKLRNIIVESVKKVLKESTLYGDATPFEEIYRAATQIMDRYQYTQDDGYESMDDDGGDVCGGVWQWAKKVAEDAEYYLQCNSSYQPINGGEDW